MLQVLVNIVYDATFGFLVALVTQLNHVTEEVSVTLVHKVIRLLNVCRLSGPCLTKTIYFMKTGE